MRSLGIVVTTLLALAALVGLGLGIYEWIVPEYTDQEILSGFVDTWEPSAWFTMFCLAVFGFIVLLSGPLAIFVRNREIRLLAVAATVFSLGGALVAYRNHAELTERTTALTGQTFGRFNGLL